MDLFAYLMSKKKGGRLIEGTGTSISLSNTSNNTPMRLSLAPSELEQNTTTGKNLVNIYQTLPAGTTYTNNGITYTINDNGTITVNGTATAQSNFYVFDNQNITLESGTYTSYGFRDNANIMFGLTVGSDEGTKFMNSFESIARQTMTNPIVKTMVIRVANGVSVTNQIVKPMLVKGNYTTSTFPEFEPYTGGIASPNPDYPQDVHTISGNNEIVVSGKNLFDGIFELGGYDTSTGNKYAGTDRIRCTDFIKVNPSETYTISFGNAGSVYVLEYDKNKTYLNKYTLVIYHILSGNFTTSADTEYITFYYIPYQHDLTLNEKCQLELGSTATDYVPYIEPQNAPLNLGNEEYCKIGNYEDEFVRTSGKNLFDKDSIVWGTEDTNILYYTIDIANGTYTMSSPNMPVGTNNVCNLFVLAGQVSNGASSSTNGVDKNTSRTLTITNGKMTIATRKTTSYNTNNPYNYDWQLEKGTTATSYEPYGTNQWYLKKNIGKVVLDGSGEGWYRSTNYDSEDYICFASETLLVNKKYIKPINIYDNTYAKSNKFTMSSWYSIYNTKEQADRISFTTDNNFVIYLKINKNTIGGTIAGLLNQWLANNNVDLYYKLSTPTYTLLDNTLQEQLEHIASGLLSYSPQTNISQVNADLPFIISASANSKNTIRLNKYILLEDEK